VSNKWSLRESALSLSRAACRDSRPALTDYLALASPLFLHPTASVTSSSAWPRKALPSPLARRVLTHMSHGCPEYRLLGMCSQLRSIVHWGFRPEISLALARSRVLSTEANVLQHFAAARFFAEA